MDQYLCCVLNEFLHIIGSTATGRKLQKILKRSKDQRNVAQPMRYRSAPLSEHRCLLEVPWDIPLALPLPLHRSMALPHSLCGYLRYLLVLQWPCTSVFRQPDHTLDSTCRIEARCGYSRQMSTALVIPWGI